MQAKLALLAEYASVSTDGKLNIMSIFDQINTGQFPAGVPIFYAVASLEAGPAEFGTQKHVEIVLHDQDSKELMRIDQTVTVPTAPRSGMRSTLNIVRGIAGLAFMKAGTFQFSILVDGRTEAEIPLYVQQVGTP